MASLLAKDAYLQSLARKICSGPSPEPQKRKSGNAQPWTGAGRAWEGGTTSPPRRSRCLPHTAPRRGFRWSRHVGA